MKHPLLATLLLILPLAGCVTNPDEKQHSGASKTTPPLKESSSLVDLSFTNLVALAKQGDGRAIVEMNRQLENHYEYYNWKENRAQLNELREPLQVAYEKLGIEASAGDENAWQLLKQSTGYDHLRTFAVYGLREGVKLDDEKAIEMLLNHRRYGILLSSACLALSPAAERGNHGAVEFQAAILKNPRKKALWHASAKSLVRPANDGNQVAIDALNLYNKKKTSNQ